MFLKRMAAWLWELSGEEPFSCYQQTAGLPQPWVDLVIRHPEATYRNGRPEWFRVARPAGSVPLRWWSPDEQVVGERPLMLSTENFQVHLSAN